LAAAFGDVFDVKKVKRKRKIQKDCTFKLENFNSSAAKTNDQCLKKR